MIRIVIFLLFVLLISACTEPRERMLPNDISQWETDKDLQSALAELTLEEQNLLATYLIRIEAELLAGNAPPENMTIGEAINVQLIWVDQWQKQRRIQQEKLLAEKNYLRSYLSRVEVADFKVLEQHVAGEAVTQKSFVGSIINKGDKPLYNVQLTIYYLDKFGNELSEVSYKPVEEQADLKNADHLALHPSEKVDFNFQVKGDIPANWTGMASATVTSIEFSEVSESIEN